MAHEANVGDVIFLESENRHVHAWGTITSEYQFKALNKSSNDELHSLGVKWHKIANGENAFRIGKGDNLLFREITKRDNLLPSLKKFIDAPLQSVPQQPDKNAPQDIEYLEGGKVLRSHLSTERSSNAAKLAKELARKRSKSGKLVCEACKCIPENDYKNTEANIDIIEAHHRIPLAKGERNTKPEDFCMLCPCCHRAVHKLININTEPKIALQIVIKCNS
jgi:predicted HNH restriction endonuclease